MRKNSEIKNEKSEDVILQESSLLHPNIICDDVLKKTGVFNTQTLMSPNSENLGGDIQEIKLIFENDDEQEHDDLNKFYCQMQELHHEIYQKILKLNQGYKGKLVKAFKNLPH